MATSRNVFDQFDEKSASNVFDQFDAPAEPALPNGNSDYAGAFFRPFIKAASFLPGLAADVGVSARNMGESVAQKLGVAEPIYSFNRKMAGNSDVLASILPGGPGKPYEGLTSQFDRAIEQAFPAPTGLANKAAEAISTGLVGSIVPGPQAAQQAPKDFAKPAEDLVKQTTLASSRKAGYAVPPSTTNPTTTNKILESLGGKIATEQDASIRNQSVTNTLAKRALGLTDDAPITQESLQALRAEAGRAYGTIAKAGEVKLDEKATQALDELASKYTSSKLAETIGGGNDIPKIVQAIKDEPLNGKSALDAIKLLREKADTSYAQGDKALGKAYRSLSGTIENLMERNLSGDTLKEFRNARQLIAKSYSVEGALNPSTGNVVATKLASQLAKGKPISGDLLTAARFGQAFPKAAREVLDSGSVRNTDVILGGGAALAAKEPSLLLYPLLRQGVRAGLLSDAGQALTVPGKSQFPPGLLMGGLLAEEQARQGLFGQ